MSNSIQTVLQIFTEQGASAYVGEPVTQLEHAIQTAQAARRNQVRPAMVTAALLHDIGHFLHAHSEDCADHQIDSEHEKAGAAFLQDHFIPEVAELVRHHVNAKRYLTATNAKYAANLTGASRQSLQLQGGPMTAAEVEAFQQHPLFHDILLLRHWDEGAKIQNKLLPAITDFLPELTACLKTA
jgi:phosphonate degradation associated HDIG domain protein